MTGMQSLIALSVKVDKLYFFFQTQENELKLFFSAYGAVKDCKIINDRAGVSKG